ncbi:MAG TPA: Fe-S protein assembly co-chaperone HscB [Blastocatellia bacterium]|nr:Fe-S protein assembly co-chaperone HscB [Blastocatellia bacterium]
MSELTIDVKRAYQSECAHCGAQFAGVHFCAYCKKIQPITPGTDYFNFLGLPRKLQLDEAELERTFYSLSREFHPDYFMTASDAERQASIERSSMLNDAYRTLRDRVKRAQYLLALEGYKEAEKKAPPDLLEEVFELNMQIEELKAAKKMGDEDELAEARSALEEALGGLQEKLSEIDERLFAMFADWDEAVDRNASDDEKKALLNQMSELLSHRSYIRNLVRDIKEEL